MQTALRSAGTSGATCAGAGGSSDLLAEQHVESRTGEGDASRQRLVERGAHAVPIAGFGWRRTRLSSGDM